MSRNETRNKTPSDLSREVVHVHEVTASPPNIRMEKKKGKEGSGEKGRKGAWGAVEESGVGNQ